ncbi:DMT family transporter [Desulforamulus aeronauticus]|uniref:Uncharacterized membrane protein n=1 Tax=Desulforamulus aeronauticus DSM 10349 TaxID=1121421 RepID=A0A1M6S2N1_9FIRM|nr:DMT family transporter [Desulforamulus aeronauticus]SHK38920.1 Uncharacterized membrane protein [Desulforamulus aeronauticus DSM 10349]
MEVNTQTIIQNREISFAKKGIGWGLLAGASWGLDAVLMGMALALAPFTNTLSLFAAPLVASCLHDGFSGTWLFIKNVISGKWREYARTLKTRPGKLILVAAIMGGPIGMSNSMLAIHFAGAAYAVAITAAYPAIGAILGAIFLKEKIGLRVWCGILLAILGSFVVAYVPPSGESHPHFYLGIGLAVIATIGWALEGVISTYGMDLVDSDIAIGIRELTSFSVSFCAILPFVGAVAYQILFASFSTSVAWYIAAIGLIGGISQLSWYRAMNMTGVARAMGLNVTYALWAVLFGWLLSDLQITSTLIIGAMLICLGTILTIGNPKQLVTIRSK